MIKNRMCLSLFVSLSLVLGSSLCAFSGETSVDVPQNEEVYETLVFDELVDISDDGNFTEAIDKKVDYVLNTVVVDNTIRKEPGDIKESDYVGKYVRMVNWNIERGIDLDRIIEIFNNPDELLKELKETNPKKVDVVKNEMDKLREADVLFLTEVDSGMPRTNYRKVAKDFAKAINFNYAYAVEFLEVDPSHLGLEKYQYSEESLLFPDGLVVDKDKYKGLHGSAILSKFPLKNVRLFRFPEVYDWYEGEKIRSSKMEKLRRSAAVRFFKEAVLREVRYGSRIALIADIEIPGLDVPVTCIVAHLENRTPPSGRRKQLKALLKFIKHTDNPVVLAGDFNTTLSDASPYGVNKKRGSRFGRIMSHLKVYNIPQKYALGPAFAAPNLLRKHTDPTIRSIPLLSANPERGLFVLLKNFEFEDDNNFDFRETKGKYVGNSGKLANSNHRNIKGFMPTYKFERPLAVGKFKLDWFFVKAFAKKPKNENDSFKFAPHFGTTMYDLNYAFEDWFSDHAPISVDLPLEEPPVLDKQQRKEAKKENDNKVYNK